MAKSLDQFEYEMQHQRFLKCLSEALAEIQDTPGVGNAIDEQWIEVLAGEFLQKCENLRVPYKFQFVAVATLVMALMTAYDKAPVDLERLPVKGKSN